MPGRSRTSVRAVSFVRRAARTSCLFGCAIAERSARADRPERLGAGLSRCGAGDRPPSGRPARIGEALLASRRERQRSFDCVGTGASEGRLGPGPYADLLQEHISVRPAAMNRAMRCLIAAKSSDRFKPYDSLSLRTVLMSVSISAPVTK